MQIGTENRVSKVVSDSFVLSSVFSSDVKTEKDLKSSVESNRPIVIPTSQAVMQLASRLNVVKKKQRATRQQNDDLVTMSDDYQ